MFSRMSGAAARSHNTLIRRITQIEIEIGAGATSASQAVTIDDPNNCIFLMEGYRLPNGATNSRSGWQPRVDFNATHVTAYTTDTSAGTIRTVAGQLIEFMPFVIEKRVMGTISIPSNGGVTADASLGQDFNLDRSVVMWLGCTTTHTGQSTGHSLATVEFQTQNTVRATRYSSAAFVCQVGYLAVQFSEGILRDFAGNAVPVLTTLIQIPKGDDDGYAESRTQPWNSGTIGYNLDIDLDEAFMVFNGYRQGGFQAETPYAYGYRSGDAEAFRFSSSTFDDSFVMITALQFGYKWQVLHDLTTFNLAPGAATDVYDVTWLGNYADGIESSLRDYKERLTWQWLGFATDNAAANIDRFPTTLLLNGSDEIEARRGFATAVINTVETFTHITLFH